MSMQRLVGVSVLRTTEDAAMGRKELNLECGIVPASFRNSNQLAYTTPTRAVNEAEK